MDFQMVFARLKVLTDITTVKELADVLEINPNHVWGWKKINRFPWDRLLQIAITYNIDVLSLIQTGNDLPFPRKKKNDLSFPKRLKKARKQNGISLRSLAEQVGTSYKTLQKWETKPPINPSPLVVKKIASILGVSSIYLFLGDEILIPKKTKKDSKGGSNKQLLICKEANQLGTQVTEIRLDASLKKQEINNEANKQTRHLEVITQEKIDLLMEQIRFVMVSEENIKHTMLDSDTPTLFHPSKAK